MDAWLPYVTASTVSRASGKAKDLAVGEDGHGGKERGPQQWNGGGGAVIYIISVIIVCPLSLQTRGVRKSFLVLDAIMFLSSPKLPTLGQASLLSLRHGEK